MDKITLHYKVGMTVYLLDTEYYVITGKNFDKMSFILKNESKTIEMDIVELHQQVNIQHTWFLNLPLKHKINYLFTFYKWNYNLNKLRKGHKKKPKK